MRILFLALGLVVSVESAWLGAKLRSVRAPLSESGGGAFAWSRPLTLQNGSGGTLTDFQVAVPTDVYPTSFDAADPALKGLWHFSEGGASATTADASGNGRTATLSIGGGGTQTTAAQAWSNGASGRAGQALSFDGTDDYAEVADNAAWEFGTNPFTIEVWFYPTQAASYQILIGHYNSAGWNLYVQTNTSTSAIDFTKGTQDQLWNYTFSLNTWYHLAIVDNNVNTYAYVNGVQIGSALPQIDTTDANVPLRIGMGATGGSAFRGLIDEVRVYNGRALSAQEISDHASLVYGLNAGLAGSWHFGSSTSGAIANGTTAGLEDTSGNGNHGTASNANGAGMAWGAGQPGGALSFAGVDDMVTIPNSATLQLPTYTVAFRVKYSGANAQQAVLYKGQDTGWSRTYSFTRVPDGRLSHWAADGVSQYFDRQTTNPLTVGQWYHVAGTFDGATKTAALYLDGELQGTPITVAFNVVQNSYPVYLGKLPAGTPFVGMLDEVRIYSRVLSAAEIAELASATPKIRPDLQDLRFSTALDGTGELPYWLETDKKAWVKVPSLPTGSTTLYALYGNPSAAFSTLARCATAPIQGDGGFAHCGTNTFLFFDDFATGDFSRWSGVGTGTKKSVVNGRAYFNGRSAGTDTLWFDLPSNRSNVVVEYDNETTQTSGMSQYGPMGCSAVTCGATEQVFFDSGTDTPLYNHRLFYYPAGGASSIVTAAPGAGNHKFRWVVNGAQLMVFINGVQQGTTKNDNNAAGLRRLYLGIESNTNYVAQTAPVSYFDNVKIRAYAASEPTASLGAESAF